MPTVKNNWNTMFYNFHFCSWTSSTTLKRSGDPMESQYSIETQSSIQSIKSGDILLSGRFSIRKAVSQLSSKFRLGIFKSSKCLDPKALQCESFCQDLFPTQFCDKVIIRDFELFCNRQHCFENLRFCTAVDQFHETSRHVAPVFRYILAAAILNNFIRRNSPEWVCLPSDMVEKIEVKMLDVDSTNFDYFDIFSEARAEVQRTIQADIVPRFLDWYNDNDLLSLPDTDCTSLCSYDSDNFF